MFQFKKYIPILLITFATQAYVEKSEIDSFCKKFGDNFGGKDPLLVWGSLTKIKDILKIIASHETYKDKELTLEDLSYLEQICRGLTETEMNIFLKDMSISDEYAICPLKWDTCYIVCDAERVVREIEKMQNNIESNFFFNRNGANALKSFMSHQAQMKKDQLKERNAKMFN